MWMQRVSGLVAIPRLLRERGVDPGRMLEAIGLPHDALASPDHRAPFAALARLLSAAAQATGCPHFGVLVGRQWTLADTGVVGALMRASSSVGEALETLTVHQRLNSQGGAAYFSRYERSATLGFAAFQPQAATLAATYDVAVAALVSGTRELVGDAWNPDEVFLPHAAPADPGPYRAHFRCPVRFDSERAEVRFSARVLDRAVDGADPARKRALEEEAARAADDDLEVRVYRSLRLLLLDGSVTGDAIAQHFAMHRRTLERRLKRRGTTFQSVLDDVRYEVASQLLRDTGLPLDRVSMAVGFAEAASFTRAFRRWAGMTPSQWRANSAAAAL